MTDTSSPSQLPPEPLWLRVASRYVRPRTTAVAATVTGLVVLVSGLVALGLGPDGQSARAADPAVQALATWQATLDTSSRAVPDGVRVTRTAASASASALSPSGQCWTLRVPSAPDQPTTGVTPAAASVCAGQHPVPVRH